MPLGIPLWKTNTAQERLFFVGPKIWSKIKPSDRNGIPTHNHLIRKQISTRYRACFELGAP